MYYDDDDDNDDDHYYDGDDNHDHDVHDDDSFPRSTPRSGVGCPVENTVWPSVGARLTSPAGTQ